MAFVLTWAVKDAWAVVTTALTKEGRGNMREGEAEGELCEVPRHGQVGGTVS